MQQAAAWWGCTSRPLLYPVCHLPLQPCNPRSSIAPLHFLPPSLHQDTYLPIMWVEIASQATQKQLRQVAPLLWARAAQHFLLTHARLAAASFAAVAAFCLSLAAVLWSSSEEGIATSGAAGGCGGRGSSDDANGALDAAERAEQREPLLPRSYPVAAEEDGRPAGEESQANGGVDNEPEQQQQQQAQGPGLVGALLQRLRSSPAAPQAPPAADAMPAAA